MKNIVIILSTLVLSLNSSNSDKTTNANVNSNLSDAIMQKEFNTIEPLTPNSINEFIPKGYQVEISVNGNLSNDSLSDIAFIINNREESDSRILKVLFKNPDSTYKLSLETTSLISSRYSTELEIKDNKLLIHSDNPWHGENNCFFEIQYTKNDWYCLNASSIHGDPNNYWVNELNYTTGNFSIKHSIYTITDETHDKVINGKIESSKPFSITKDDYYESLTVNYQGNSYYIWDRNDLWSEEELFQLLPVSYKKIVGNWNSIHDEKIYISFNIDGTFYFNDYNDKSKRYEYLSGNYDIKGKYIILNYGDRKSQTFSQIEMNGVNHITKTGGYDFTKSLK